MTRYAYVPASRRPMVVLGTFVIATVLVVLGVILLSAQTTTTLTTDFLRPIRDVRPLGWWGEALIAAGAPIPLVLTRRYWSLGLIGTLFATLTLCLFAYSFIARASTLAEWMLADYTVGLSLALLGITFTTISEHQRGGYTFFGAVRKPLPADYRVLRPLIVMGAALSVLLFAAAIYLSLYLTRTVTTVTKVHRVPYPVFVPTTTSTSTTSTTMRPHSSNTSTTKPGAPAARSMSAPLTSSRPSSSTQAPFYATPTPTPTYGNTGTPLPPTPVLSTTTTTLPVLGAVDSTLSSTCVTLLGASACG